MSIFKIQRIRACTRCGDVLSQKCEKCLKHPNRAPKVVELFSWPKPLKMAECECCFLIRCQREGCAAPPFWRNMKSGGRQGLSRSQKLYCTQRCNLVSQNVAKDTRVPVPCGWCRKSILRRASHGRNFKAAYCLPEHYFLAMRKAAHKERESKKDLLDDPIVGMLWCERCEQVREHDTPRNGSAICRSCKRTRNQKMMIFSRSETGAMSRLENPR